MKRVTKKLVLSALVFLLVGCSPSSPQELQEFEGQGRIRGSFHLGDQTLQGSGWVEMVELTGLPSERCGPGDCGLAVDALLHGTFWNPGRWRVVAPPVEGWTRPTPFEIMVRADRVTVFEAEYQPSYIRPGLDCSPGEGTAFISYGGVSPAGPTLTQAREAAFALPPKLAGTAQAHEVIDSGGKSAEVIYVPQDRRVARVFFRHVMGGWAITGYRSCAGAQNIAD